MTERNGTTAAGTFRMPPRLYNQQGVMRRAGFELEFAGLTVAQTAKMVAELVGGRCTADNSFRQTVAGSRHGDFRIELDSLFLKDKRYLTSLRQLGIDLESPDEEMALEEFLTQTASLVVPIEVITPPLPLTELNTAEELRAVLHAHQARGTKASLFYAFGLHINIEAPALDGATLCNYLRAFLLLEEWIAEEAEIDLTRRLMPYINPFPEPFISLVLDPDYAPDREQLTVDYLRHNPTRNRPLDLTPLFAWLDEERVRRTVHEKDLVKKRPAFHYRLPNCLIDQPAWTIAREWNLWVAVETLAADPERIEAMSTDYLLTKESPLEFLVREWPEKVRRWME